MVEHQVHGRPGDDSGKLLQQLDRVEEQMRGAVAPDRFECDEDAAIRTELDAVLGERRAEEIAAELFEAGAIIRRDPDVGVEIEAVELGLPRTARSGVTEIRLVAEAAHARASAWAEGDPALDRGPREAGQNGRGLAERIGRRAVVGRLDLAAGE